MFLYLNNQLCKTNVMLFNIPYVVSTEALLAIT